MFGLFNGSNTDITDDIEVVLRPMAGMAIAKKFALHDIVGDVETWQADLESAVLLLNENEFRDIQIIGTYAFDDGTWLWAWGNQGSDFAENIVRDSFALQRYGKENGITWLTERTFELEQDDVEAVAAVAIGIVQADGYYLAFHDAGIAVFSLRDPRLKQALVAENPARATVVIPEMVATFVLYQQHEAVAEYLRQAGYQIEQSENGKHIGITAQRNGSVLKADFEDGFFRDLSAQLQK